MRAINLDAPCLSYLTCPSDKAPAFRKGVVTGVVRPFAKDGRFVAVGRTTPVYTTPIGTSMVWVASIFVDEIYSVSVAKEGIWIDAFGGPEFFHWTDVPPRIYRMLGFESGTAMAYNEMRVKAVQNNTIVNGYLALWRDKNTIVPKARETPAGLVVQVRAGIESLAVTYGLMPGNVRRDMALEWAKNKGYIIEEYGS